MNDKIYLPGTVGERVKDLQTAGGITIKELSEKAGLTIPPSAGSRTGRTRRSPMILC